MQPYTETLDRVLEVVVLLQGDMERELSARGLTQARTHVLWELARRPQASQKELADAVGVVPRTMTGLVDGLESSGFVVRRPHPVDRRAYSVELTAKGRETVQWLVTSHAELAEAVFGDMAPRAYHGFATGLTQVLERLRAVVQAGAPS